MGHSPEPGAGACTCFSVQHAGCHSPCSASCASLGCPCSSCRVRPELTACGCKWLGSHSSMLSLHPGSLLQLQTGIHWGGQRLCLSLRGLGRKVCGVFVQSQWVFLVHPTCSTATLPSHVHRFETGLGCISDFFPIAVLFLSIGSYHIPSPSAMSSAFCSLALA